MPWSIACLRAFRLSVGESLLSMPRISNFTPAGLLALYFSAKNCTLFSWLLPTGPMRPDSGSIQAIFTTWPASGLAAPWANAAVGATSDEATPPRSPRASGRRSRLERKVIGAVSGRRSGSRAAVASATTLPRTSLSNAAGVS